MSILLVETGAEVTMLDDLFEQPTLR